MKKTIRFLITILILTTFLSFSTSADGLWNNEYYRVIDGTGELSDVKIESLDETCSEFREAYKTDLVLAAVNTADYEGLSFEDLAEGYFDDYSYGYGADRDCIIFVADMEKEEAEYVTFGNASSLVEDSYYEFAKSKVFDAKEEYGVYGVLYSGARYISGHLEDLAEEEATGKKTPAAAPAEEKAPEPEAAPAAETAPENAAPSSEESAEEGRSLPDWYVTDPASFEFFHDETAPRVNDYADIFTDDEEKEMEGRITEIRSGLQKDVVVYTDISSYGKGHKLLAADFYDMNGYGYGPEYEGICLFICMDPDERGWWAACSGTKTMGIYSEDVANAMDDALYPYMKSGDYGAGVLDWIDNVGTLYEKGNPFAPDWMPSPGEEPERFRDPAAPRIVDEVGLFTDSEKAELTSRAREVSGKYDVDLVIHTVPEVASTGMSHEEFAEAFYKYNGYGLGDGYDGILFVAFARQYDDEIDVDNVTMYTEGRGGEKLTEVNRDRLLGYAQDGLDYADDKYKGTLKLIKVVDHMEKTGRVPRSTLYWAWIAVSGSLAGAIAGGFSLGRAKKNMEVPKLSGNADIYMDSSKFFITGNDVFLNTTSTRKYSPVKTESYSGGSSSSHRSSYSSHYSGSTGRSHSGSGRRF